MNHARVNKSKRLQRVAAVLKDGRAYSTWQIMQRAKVCAVSAIVSELRANGHKITCQRKGDVWWYRRAA